MLKRLTTILLACLLFSPCAFSGQFEPHAVAADRAFTFKLKDLKERTHSLGDYRGKVVLINFWASWCLPCLQEMPSMKTLADKLENSSFVLLTLNTSDSSRRIRETLKRLRLELTVLQDNKGKTTKAWQVEVLPTSFLLDRNGEVRYRVVGPVEWDDADVILKIKQLIQSQ